MPCLIGPPQYNATQLCYNDTGVYILRDQYFGPPGADSTDTMNYYCLTSNFSTTMEGVVIQGVSPCDGIADCMVFGDCWDTGDNSADADLDNDTDYCLSNIWYDCLDDTNCQCGFTCSGNDCVPAFEDTAANCADSPVDNDCDTLVDCADPDCTPFCGCVPIGPEVCTGGVDEDCDGDVDDDDSDCFTCFDTGEDEWWVAGESDCDQCDNFGDQDGDGCLDAWDSDCGNAETDCADTFDNDCDGLTDAADPDCSLVCSFPGNERDLMWFGEPDCNQCDVAGDQDMDGLEDYEDPDCCDWCESQPGWEWDQSWADCAGATDFDWESVPPQQEACCGDDPLEFFTTAGVGPEMCCDAATDCVDTGGTCRIGYEISPGGCTDSIDNDCDGFTDVADPNCQGTITGHIEDDLGTDLEDVLVTAVAVDPITKVTVNFSGVTDVNGDYVLTVVVNLTYDVVAVLPGYETGFDWDDLVEQSTPRVIDFILPSALNCEADCTAPGADLCRPACHTVNGCAFWQDFGGDARSMQRCEDQKAGWLVPFNFSHRIACCEEQPSPRTQIQIVNIEGPEHVVSVNRIISYGGQLIRLVINVFE